MLIHITPNIYIPYFVKSCELVSLKINELGVCLTSVDLATRKPFPNKRIRVACKRVGQKAISGVLFDTVDHVADFTSVARWSVVGLHRFNSGADLLVTHTTKYKVLDDKYDCVSDHMLLWYDSSSGQQKWERRWADWAKDLSPAQAQPRMELIGEGPDALPKEAHRIDTISSCGVIIERTETFGMLTIQRERLRNSSYVERMPALESAVQCTKPIRP